MTLSNPCSSVKVVKDLSEPLDTVRGFGQGGPLSCDLFNFLMESATKGRCAMALFSTRVSSFLRTPTALTALSARCELSPLRLVLSNGSLRTWVCRARGQDEICCRRVGSCLVWDPRTRIAAIISRLTGSLYTLAPPLTQTTTSVWKSST